MADVSIDKKIANWISSGELNSLDTFLETHHSEIVWIDGYCCVVINLAFSLACANVRQLVIVEYFLKKWKENTAVNIHYEMCVAIRKGKFALLELIFSYGCICPPHTTFDFKYNLFVNAVGDSTDEMRAFLKAKGLINARTYEDLFAYAVFKCDMPMVKYYVETCRIDMHCGDRNSAMRNALTNLVFSAPEYRTRHYHMIVWLLFRGGTFAGILQQYIRYFEKYNAQRAEEARMLHMK